MEPALAPPPPLLEETEAPAAPAGPPPLEETAPGPPPLEEEPLPPGAPVAGGGGLAAPMPGTCCVSSCMSWHDTGPSPPPAGLKPKAKAFVPAAAPPPLEPAPPPLEPAAANGGAAAGAAGPSSRPTSAGPEVASNEAIRKGIADYLRKKPGSKGEHAGAWVGMPAAAMPPTPLHELASGLARCTLPCRTRPRLFTPPCHPIACFSLWVFLNAQAQTS